MSLNKDGQDRMEGYLHAQANTDSGRPEVQFYKQHYGSLFSGSRASSSDDQAKGIAVIGIIAVIISAFGASTGYIGDNWHWIAPVGGLVLLLMGCVVAHVFLPNFLRTALTLFLSGMTLFVIGLGIRSILNVYGADGYQTFRDYFEVNKPLPMITGFGGLYGLGTFVFCLLPWARRKRSLRQMIAHSVGLLIAVPAFMITLGLIVMRLGS